MNTSKLADWSEILASIAVVVSLVFLLQEVRDNTRAIERQAAIERTTRLTAPFFESEALRAAVTKVAVVDGPAPSQPELIERYGLTPDEAIVLFRHLLELWRGLEADYSYGDRESVREDVRLLLTFPDNRIFVRGLPFDGAFGELIDEVLAAQP